MQQKWKECLPHLPCILNLLLMETGTIKRVVRFMFVGRCGKINVAFGCQGFDFMFVKSADVNVVQSPEMLDVQILSLFSVVYSILECLKCYTYTGLSRPL